MIMTVKVDDECKECKVVMSVDWLIDGGGDGHRLTHTFICLLLDQIQGEGEHSGARLVRQSDAVLANVLLADSSDRQLVLTCR